MKFSITAASIFAFAFLSTAVRADSASTAIDEFCGGLDVTAPTENDVFVAGQNSTVTVTRVPNDHQKIITGLDLYSVGSDGTPKYVQNTWAGSFSLNTQASISDTVPSNAAAGLYYYRVWVSNLMSQNQRGPDCIKLSRTFKVSTGSHTNDAGFTSYAESLDDPIHFNSDHANGCFGLSILSPKTNDTAAQGSHVSIEFHRDSASAAKSITKLEIYKVAQSGDELVDTVWSGKEALSNVFIAKDQLKIPSDKFDANVSYYYLASVTSEYEGQCSFKSSKFKITA